MATTAVAMHGDKTQRQREKALASFEAGRVDTLVATDVAARGIDVDGISHVINFDPPEDREGYVHRIGRTGRAGRTGIGITFVGSEHARRRRADRGRAAPRDGVRGIRPSRRAGLHRRPGRRPQAGRALRRRRRAQQPHRVRCRGRQPAQRALPAPRLRPRAPLRRALAQMRPALRVPLQVLGERQRRMAGEALDGVADDVQLTGGDRGVGRHPAVDLPWRRTVVRA